MSDYTFADIQHDREECKKAIERAERFNKLMVSRAFKEFILEGYFKDELTRLTDLIPLVAKEQKERVLLEIEAIARFKQYIEMPAKVADQARVHLESLDEAEAELRNNGDNEFLEEA